MKVTVMPIVTGALRTALKRLEKRLEELEIESTQTTAFLRSARMLRRVPEV